MAAASYDSGPGCSDHVKESLQEVQQNLQSKPVTGYLIIDYLSAMYGTLHGTTKCILFQLDFVKRRGGMSTMCGVRYLSLRREKGIHRVLQRIRQHFFDENNAFVPPVQLLVVAGCGLFKKTFYDSPLWDQRVRALIQQPLLDIQSRGIAGFHEAINQSSCSGGSPLVRGSYLIPQHNLLADWMGFMARGEEDQVVFGVRETLHAYEAGMVKHLLVWDQLPDVRYTVQCANGSTVVLIARTPPILTCGDTLSEEIALIQWMMKMDTAKWTDTITIVSDVTHQGMQFCQGLGGLGGFLRYAWTSQTDKREKDANVIDHVEDDDDDARFS